MLNRVDITYKRMLIYERMFESRGVAEGLIDPFAFCVCLAAAKEAEQSQKPETLRRVECHLRKNILTSTSSRSYAEDDGRT